MDEERNYEQVIRTKILAGGNRLVTQEAIAYYYSLAPEEENSFWETFAKINYRYAYLLASLIDNENAKHSENPYSVGEKFARELTNGLPIEKGWISKYRD